MTPEVALIYAEAAKYLGIGIMGSFAFGLVAIGEGLVAAKAMEAMGRNPEASDSIFTRMVIAMAICESTAIYALVVALILLFAV
jgi:F-type H+-transporting ATPase subunit c